MADIYKDARQAKSEARSRGQAVAEGSYKPGDIYKSTMGEDYRPGIEADKYLANKRTAIQAPVTSARNAAAADATKASGGMSSDDFVKMVLAETAAQPQAAPASQSKGSLGGDAVRAIGSGALGLASTPYELANLATFGGLDSATKSVFGKSGSEAIQSAQDAIRSGESSELKAEREKLNKADGIIDSFATVLSNPRLAGSMAMEMVPQLLSVAGAAKKAAQMTFTSAVKRGVAEEAAQKAAETAATRTVLGLNATMEGTGAASGARQDVMTMSEADLSQSPQYQALVQQYGDTPDGRSQARQRLANDAAMFSMAVATPIALLAGKVTGAAELESKVMTRGVQGVGREAEKRTALGVAKDIGKAGLSEVPEEAAEEGSGQFAQNVGMLASGANPNQDLTEGVAQAAGAGGAMGMLAGAGFGGVGHARTALSKPQADASTPSTETPQTTQEAPSTPQSTQGFMLHDHEYQSLTNSHEFMAAMFANADPDTRQRLQAANPNLNLEQLSQDSSVVGRGQTLIQNSPGSLIAAFNNHLPPLETVAPPAQSNTEPPFATRDPGEPPRDPVPWREKERLGQELINESRTDAESQVGAGSQGDENPVNPNLPPLDVMLGGYQRQAQNLMSLPNELRSIRARDGMQQMIERGFTPEQANSVFGHILNPEVNAQTGDTNQGGESGLKPLGQSQEVEQEAVPDQKTERELKSKIVQAGMTKGEKILHDEIQFSPNQQAVQSVANALGIKVYSYKGGMKSPLGMSLNGRNTILLNLGRLSNDAHQMFVLGHEVWHQLKVRDPKMAKRLEGEIRAYFKDNAVDKQQQSLRSRYEGVAKTLGVSVEEMLNEESTADVMGIMFNDKAFWTRVAKRDPNLLRQIIEILGEMLQKISGYRKKDKYPARAQELKSSMIKIGEVRKMMAEALTAVYGKNAAPELPPVDVEEQVSEEPKEAPTGLTDEEIASQYNPDGTLDTEMFEPDPDYLMDEPGLTADEQATVDQVKQMIRDGKTKEAAAAFSASNLYKTKGVNFNRLIQEAKQPAAPVRPVAPPVEEAPQPKPTEAAQPQIPDNVKVEIARLYREKAGSLGNMNANERINQLRSMADDLRQTYGFTDEQIANTLQGEMEVIDPKTLEGKKVKFGYDPRTEMGESHAKRESEVIGKQGNPAVTVGTTQPESKPDYFAPGVKESISRTQRTKIIVERVIEARKKSRSNAEILSQVMSDRNDGLAPITEKEVEPYLKMSDKALEGQIKILNQVIVSKKQNRTSFEDGVSLDELKSRPYSDLVARQVISRETDKDGKASGDPMAQKVGELRKDGKVVGYVFYAKRADEDGNNYFRFTIKPDNTFAVSRAKTIDAFKGNQKNPVDFRPVNETPGQSQLALSNPGLNKYKARLKRIMTTQFTPSQVQETLKELRAAIKRAYEKQRPFLQYRNKQSDVEYIFKQFADVGAMESGKKGDTKIGFDKLSGERAEVERRGGMTAIQKLQKAIEAAQAGDVRARAGLLRVHADAMMDEVENLRLEMAENGIDMQTIEEVTGDALRGLDNLMAQDNSADIEKALIVAQKRIEQKQAEENKAKEQVKVSGKLYSNQMTLDDPLLSARIEAANAAINAIVEDGESPIAVIRRELAKEDREFSFSDLRKALAARGYDIKQIDREVAQWPAAQYSLAYWVKKHSPQIGAYAARDVWFNSYENIQRIYRDEPQMQASFERELSDGERRVIEMMRQQRQNVETRRNERMREILAVDDGELIYDNVRFDNAEEAFPFALFHKFRLADLRDPATIKQKLPAKDIAALEYIARGRTQLLYRIWLDDVIHAMDARKDLQDQILNRLTTEEQIAVLNYRGYLNTVIAQNQRQSALATFNTILEDMNGLPKKAYEGFRNQIMYADVKAIPSILHRATEVAEIVRSSRDKKQLGSALTAYLNTIFHEDERISGTLDENQEQYDQIENGKTADVSDEEIDQYLNRLRRLGEAGADMTREEARLHLLYDKIAEMSADEAAEESSRQLQENEASAGEQYQPESQAGLSGDIRYKRGRFSGHMAQAAVDAHLRMMTSDWESQPNFQVYFHPDQIQDQDLKNRLVSRVEAGAFKGAVDPETGVVYLFSQNLESLEDAEFVLTHELYGHWGIRAFLGDKINPFLENQYRLNKKVKEEADRQFDEALAEGAPMSRLESIEEAISDMATKGEGGLFRQLIGKLVKWLRSKGMDTVADWMDSTGSNELAHVLSQARKVARTQQGISPLQGAPSQVMYQRGKLPIEMFSERDGKVTGYARLNPVNQMWTVFTVRDIATGNFSATIVEDIQAASKILKKVGKITKSANRETRQDFDPNNLHRIPDASDLTGWAKIKREMQIRFQNMYLPVFEVAQYLSDKGLGNSVIHDLTMYEGRLKYFIDGYRKTYQEPIQKLLKEAGEKGATVEDIDLFLNARHAEERNRAIHAINPTNPNGSGISTAEAKQILASDNHGQWKEYREQLEKLGQLMDDMSKSKLNYMLQTGLITKYQYANLSKYQHYVNLSGNADDMDKYDKSELGGYQFNLNGADIIRSTGRGTRAIEVLQNTMNSYLSTLIRGQKNRPVTAILEMLELNPDSTFAQVEQIREKKVVDVEKLNFDRKIMSVIGDAPGADSGASYLRKIQAQLKDGQITMDDALGDIVMRINDAEARRDIDPEMANRALSKISEQVAITGRLSPDGYVSMMDVSHRKEEGELVAKVNGQQIKITFKKRGQEFFQSLTGLNVQRGTGFVEAMGKWNRLFSQLVTTWNPAWIPVNGIRDIQTAFANAAADPNVGVELANKMRKQWMSSYRTAFRHQVIDKADTAGGFWGKYLRGRASKYPMDPAEAKLYAEFREDGAETYFLDRAGLEESLDKLNRHMNGPQGMLELTQDKLEAIGSAMEVFTLPMETAPRFAMYKVLREAGKSREEAAKYAKELTVNFNMKGSNAMFRSLFVFANPAIQGTYRLFQDYSRSKEGIGKYMPSNRFAAVAGTWMMLGMVANMMARALGGEDEEKEGVDVLDTIPAYKRATSLVLIPDMPGGAIPIAYGWNVYATAGTYIFDVMADKIKPDVAATRLMSAAFDAFAPIGSGAESQSFVGAMAKTFTPTPLMPLVEMGMNENRFGAPIYKGQNPFSDVKESDAYLHFNSVNPISKAVMHALAEATSGGRNARYNEALIDINPATVDHMINSYLPGLFAEAYKFAGWSVNAAEGRNTKELATPLVDRFNAKVPEGFDAGAFRRVSEAVDTLDREYKAGDTSPDRRKEIRDDYPGLGGLKGLISGTTQQIKKLRQELSQIEQTPGVTDEAKIERRNFVEDQEKRLYARAVKAAIRSGFKDEVIDNRSSGVVDQVGAIIR